MGTRILLQERDIQRPGAKRTHQPRRDCPREQSSQDTIQLARLTRKPTATRHRKK